MDSADSAPPGVLTLSHPLSIDNLIDQVPTQLVGVIEGRSLNSNLSYGSSVYERVGEVGLQVARIPAERHGSLPLHAPEQTAEPAPSVFRVPQYHLSRNIKTANDGWREWTVGLRVGLPAVKELEKQC